MILAWRRSRKGVAQPLCSSRTRRMSRRRAFVGQGRRGLRDNPDRRSLQAAPKPTNQLHETLDIRDRRFWQNSVAEVENERRSIQLVPDSPYAFVQCGPASDQRQRVEIALKHRPHAKLCANNRDILASPERQAVTANRRRKPHEIGPSFPRKRNDTQGRSALTQSRHNSRQRLDTPCLNWSLGSNPAQESKICTTSTPALS